MLLLNINRKSYMGTLIALSHLTLHMLGNLERSYLRSLIFWSPISHEGAKLGHMLLININGKPYTWEVLIFDLQWPWKIKVKVTQILMSYISQRGQVRPLTSCMVPDLYIILIFLRNMKSGYHTREFVGRRGFPLSQQSVLFLIEYNVIINFQ